MRRIVQNGKEFALIGKSVFISDFYKMNAVVIRNLFLIILAVHFFTGMFSQTILSDYGVQRHGLTIEEPFHSGRYMYEDSLGRLIVHNSVFIQNPMVYDGTTFIPFSYKHKRKLLSTSHNEHWYETGPFIATFDDNKRAFHIDVRDYLKRNISFLHHEKEDVFLFCNDGYIKLRLDQDSCEVIQHHQLDVTRIFNAHFSNDTIYLHTEKGFGYIKQNDIEKEITFYDIEGVQNNRLFLLPNGQLIINGKKGRHLINSNQPYYSFLLAQKGSYIDLYFDSQERLWTYLRNENYYGVYIFLKGERIPSKIDLGEGPIGNVQFYEDNIGGIWMGSAGQGIFHLYKKSISILNKESGYYDDNILCVQQHPHLDKQYISCNCTGIDILEGGKPNRHFLEKNCQNPILIDTKGRLWISTGEIRVYKDEKILNTYTKKDGLHSRTVSFLFEDSHQDIWVGTRQVLHKYNGNGFTKYQIPELDTYDRIFNIVETEDGRFLLAVDNGSFYWFEGETFEKIEVEPINSMNLFQDSEKNIWLATEDRGLMIFKNNAFKEVAANHRIPKSITFLQESNNGLLFGLCSNNTIFYALKNDLLSENPDGPVFFITIDNGLPLIDSNAKNQPSSALLNDGTIIFPNIYGGIRIDPESLVAPKQPFKQLIYVGDTLVSDDRINLPYAQNYLSFSLANSYLNPQANIENQYSIKNDSWNTIDDIKNIRLLNIPRGENVLKFRARHSGGQWLPVKKLKLYTPKLIYERWWFFVLVTFVFGSTIYLFSQWRNKSIAHRNKLLQKKVDKQTEELKTEKLELAKSLSAQQALTQELNLSQQSKNRMYAQISHEFKSPLQAIKAHLSKGENFILSEDKTRIQGNIENLLSISNEIMELSKAESGALRVKKNFYNINAIIQDQIELILPLAEEKSLTFKHTNKEQPVYLDIDISLMQKALNNLLSNAIKFSPNNDTISIESETRGNQHSIKVIDNGPGIPEDETEQLTQAYYQASNNTKKGTGIGLSLVKEILLLHDSKLNIESTLGTGSSFGFALAMPELSQNEIAKRFVDTSDIHKQMERLVDRKKPVILAVDDSIDVLNFIKLSLSKTYNVITSNNGKEGLEALPLIKPDLIISDLNMPVMTGFEFLKVVRNDVQYQAVPFIFLTGSMSESTEIMSIKFGADQLLQKPVDEDILVLQVNKTMSRKATIESSSKSKFTHDLLPSNIHNDDLKLMKSLEDLFLTHLDNPKLKSEDVASMMGIGEKTLRNRIKKITKMTIKEYLRNFRLEKAKLLIEEGNGTLGEISIATGFSSLSYFSKSYKAYFGKSASKVQRHS